MFLSVPAFAESWIYVKSSAVEQVINSNMVAPEKRGNVKAAYEKYMDDQGRISSEGILYVCNAAGFDLTKRGGEADCKNMIKKMMDLSGYAAGATAKDAKECKETFDGIWTVDASGKGKCVDILGNVLDYRNACTSKIEKGICEKRFSRASVQYAVAKNVAKRVFNVRGSDGTQKHLTCKNRTIMQNNNATEGNYLLCAANGKPFTVEFKEIRVQGDTFDETFNKSELLCRIANKDYGATTVSYGSQFGGGTGAVCVKDNDNRDVLLRDYIKYKTSECNQITSWAKEFGGMQAGLVPGAQESTSVVMISNGSSAAKPIRGLCAISGGGASQNTLLNELAQYGFDNYAFMDVTVNNNEDAIEKIREYTRMKLNSPNVKVECETFTKRMAVGKNLVGFANEFNDVLRCTIDGDKRVDFVFKSLRAEKEGQLKSGIGGLECVGADGVFDGSKCRMLGEAGCKKLMVAMKDACPECIQPEWTGTTCRLPDAARQANLETTGRVIKSVGMIAVGVVLTVATEGAGAPLLIYAVGAGMEMTAEVAMKTWVYDQYISKAEKCGSMSGKAQEQCAIDFINEYSQAIKSYQKEFSVAEQHAVDEVLSRLFNMIPAESDFWLYFVQDENLFDPVTCTMKTKHQFWQYVRQIGVALQLIGTVCMMANKFTKAEEIVGRKIEERVLAIGGSGGQGERNQLTRLGLRETFNEPAKDVGRLQYMDRAGIKFGKSMTNAEATGILQEVYGITAKDLYKGTLNTVTGKITLENGRIIDAIIPMTKVIDEGKTVVHISYDLSKAVVPATAAALALGREAHYLSKKAPNGLKIPICFEKPQEFVPGDIVINIETEENPAVEPAPIVTPGRPSAPGQVAITPVPRKPNPGATTPVAAPSTPSATVLTPAPSTSGATTPANTPSTPGQVAITPVPRKPNPGATTPVAAPSTPSTTVLTPAPSTPGATTQATTPSTPGVVTQQPETPWQVSASVTGTETPVITGSPQENPQQPAKNDHIGLKATAITAGALAIGGAVGLLVSKNNKNKSTELNNNVDNSRFAKSNDRTTLGVVDVDWNKLFMTPRSQSFDVSGAKNVLDDNMKQVSNLIDSGAPSPSGFCISVRSRPSQFAGLVKSQYEQNLSRFGGSGRLQYLVNDAELNDSSCTAEQCPMIRTVVRKGACVGL